jgi:FkbM family methyltransferase
LLNLTGRIDRTIIDVGAHRGQFTRLILDNIPAANVFALEADSDLCGELAELFRSQVRVKISNIALHEQSAKLDFFVHQDKGTSSLLPRSLGTRRYFHSEDRVVSTRSIQADSLDGFMKEHHISHVDLLKLDTQGAEGPILRGARKALSEGLIDIIYTEFFVVPHYAGAELLHQLWKQLAEHGYILYDLFKGPHGRNGQLRFGDAIFVSSGFSREFLDSCEAEI